MSTLEARGLVKRFGPQTAVDGLSFSVGEGEIFGILGPNGSGKTTTVRMLSCLISPSGGDATVGGHDIKAEPLRVREIVGVLTENPSLYERLTARENLDFFARAYGLTDQTQREARIREVLEFFDLWGRRGDKVGTYSKGMKQKLAIARAIVHSPPILFLDEPTSGLDPEAQRDIRELMERLSRQERHTILLCTHNLEDAERLCTHVMIIAKGQSIVTGTTGDLRRRIAGKPKLEVRLVSVNERLVKAVEKVGKVEASEGRIVVDLEDLEGGTPEVVKKVVSAGGQVKSVSLLEPSLEDAYLKLIREAGA